MRRWIVALVFLTVCLSASAQTVTTETTSKLTGDGPDAPMLPVPAGAVEPETGLTPTLSVNVPNGQAPHVFNLVQPFVAIPYSSSLRQFDATWNGSPLFLIDPAGTQLNEEPHGYGSNFDFFKPLFSLAGKPAGAGTLEIRGYDASHALLSTVSIPNLILATEPAHVATATIAAMPHPRIYLTPARLAAIQARGAGDIARQRYEAQLQNFLSALHDIPDVLSPEFENRIYSSEDYIPLLGLTYQLKKTSDPTTATACANAAHALVMRIADEYTNGTRTYDRDSGYDIRFGLREMMLGYDWIYDRFTPAERAELVTVATGFVDWYHANGYSESFPLENYYAGYIQGLSLTAVATAGDNTNADRFFTLLRAKLREEMPTLNQRAAGGDWPEGWNYGWYTNTEFSLVNTLLKDLGEDWSFDFDWIQHLPMSLTYGASPDFSATRPFGDYSADYADSTSPSTLCVLSTTTTDGAYAYRLYTSMNAAPANGFHDTGDFSFYEMIFASPQGTTASVAGLPLSYLNAGSGRFFSRSSMTDTNSYWVSTENTPYSNSISGHFGRSNGDTRLYHGGTCLVCPSAYEGNPFDGLAGTTKFSSYIVNGDEQGLSLSKNNQNLFYLEQGNFAAIGMRFESAYAPSRYDQDVVDPAGPLDYMIREVVHLRPGTLIVRDLHRRRHSTDTLAANWHLGPTNAVQNLGGGRYQIGTLNVSTFYPGGVTVAFSNDNDLGDNRIGTLMHLSFTSSTAPLELITVFSETLTATSYTGGVLTLSDGTPVIFGGNDHVRVGNPPPAPTNLVATTNAAASAVTVTWQPSTGATSYELARSANGGGFITVSSNATSPYTDNTVGANIAYLYKVRASNGSFSSYSNVDLATTVPFSDEPISSAVTSVRATHLTELRTAVDLVRAAAGLPAGTYTDPTITPNVTVIKAAHLTELRSQLNAALAALGLVTPTYTDSALTSGISVIRKEHIGELRAAVK
ncbi:MAG TPA: hypothetical protein VLV78_08300 [Thermoanaerobaculia bacterium]|nr:hypothetical protein [Thermoanaerobaculia bacterium]